ncbi:hypothetical protein BX600DRAFT_519148 [Xylariales sp. PMI_506]|nr:hypothetical protein BX600DRAFT_519148 [Xylariales sp. PMI_506]
MIGGKLLALAVRWGHVGVVEGLLELGFAQKPRSSSDAAEDPLVAAVEVDSEGLLQRLLKGGALMYPPTISQATQFAITNGHTAVADMLRSHESRLAKRGTHGMADILKVEESYVEIGWDDDLIDLSEVDSGSDDPEDSDALGELWSSSDNESDNSITIFLVSMSDCCIFYNVLESNRATE